MVRQQRLRRVLAKLFLAVVLPLVALAGWLIYQVVDSERQTRLQAMQDLARTLSAAVDAEVDRSVLALQMLATDDAFDRFDALQSRARFEQAKSLHGRWSSMSLFEPDGTRLLNLRAPPGLPVPSGSGPETGLDAAVRAGRTFVSDVVLSATTGRPTVFFGVPAMRDGVPAYGIAATMEYDVWTDWLKQRIPQGTIAAIDDRQGVIFARSERPEPFVGKPAADAVRQAYAVAPSGIVRSRNREGTDIHVAYATSPVSGWHTLIIVPASVVGAGPQRYAVGFAVGTAVVLLFTLAAAMLLARPLASGIEHLRESIRRVGLGATPDGSSSPIAELDEAEQAARQAAERLAAARDELVRQREELRTMLELLPVGVAVAHDASAQRITVSPRFERILGLQPGQNASLSGPQRAAIPYRCLRAGEEIPGEQLPLQRAARDGIEVRDEEFDVELADGSLMHVLVNAAPLFDDAGQVRGAIAAHIDVTSLKRAQHALQLADRQKNEFLATLAHELRNPMAPIRYATELLRPDATPAMIEQARSTIERQSAHMARLLDDLIDLSRITRNVIELKRERVDLQPIVRAAVDNAQPQAREQRHTLLLQPGPGPLWVDGDPARLQQIVDNLLSNACKYTPDGGRIVVSTAAAGDRCEVRVTDDGVGLTPDMIPEMFSLFGQMHRSLSMSRGGLGIGLTVVRRLVELHGGTIDVTSPGLGAGATFVVRLPLVPAPAASGPAPGAAAQARAAGRPEVLVVDDNVDAAETLASVLRLLGFGVRTAHSAEAALERVADWHPDAAVLDIGLPGASGNQLARRLREMPWGRDMLLIAVTGWGQHEDRGGTAAAGFDVHLVKPVESRQVREAIDAFVARRAGGVPPQSATHG